MVRGTRQQVIEINDTGNGSIRKAILFLEPDPTQSDPERVLSEAHRYLKITELTSGAAPAAPPLWSRILRTVWRIGIGVVIGAISAVLIFR